MRGPFVAKRAPHLFVTDFRRNPSAHMRDALGDTLAILSRNKVEFYAVPPERFEGLIDRIEALEGGRR